ncbi:hypothetical protein ACQPZ2_23925 [Nocardia pseudovaccinii]
MTGIVLLAMLPIATVSSFVGAYSTVAAVYWCETRSAAADSIRVCRRPVR